jgi:hypothetical protein
MLVAGLPSGLLRIGSGALEVLATDMILCLPFKVSTPTGNFMIGRRGGGDRAGHTPVQLVRKRNMTCVT